MEQEQPLNLKGLREQIEALLVRIACEREDEEPADEPPFVGTELALLDRVDRVLRRLDTHTEALCLLLRSE